MGSAPASFAEILKESTARGANDVPGVVLGAINKKGKLIYDGTAGNGGVAEDAQPIAKDGVMWVASCTKLITSVCALQCVERGLITLDEPIGRILPELANPQIVTLDSTAENGFTLKDAKNPITLRLLITHTSGVGYGWMSPAIQAWRKVHGPSAEQLAGTVVANYSTPLLFEPGEGWVYGGGLDWAGVVVERLNGGITLGDYMKKEIFDRFGMNSTTFHLDQRPDLKARLVPATRRDTDGTLTVNKTPLYAESVTEHSGGGGLWSTLPDYINVLGDLVKDEPTLLKKETVENLMFAPQITEDGPLASLVRARATVGANASPAAAGVNYGLGGMYLTKDSPVLPKGTLSWGGLPNLKWFINRDLGVAAMYASQVVPPGDAKATALSNHYFQEVVRLAKEEK